MEGLNPSLQAESAARELFIGGLTDTLEGMMDWSLQVHFTSLRLDLKDEWWENILEMRATALDL